MTHLSSGVQQLRSEDVGLASFYKKGRPEPTDSRRKKKRRLYGACQQGEEFVAKERKSEFSSNEHQRRLLWGVLAISKFFLLSLLPLFLCRY